MGSGTSLCEHRRVLTTCPICRKGIPRARASLSSPAPAAAQHKTEFQRDRADVKLGEFLYDLGEYIDRERAASYARFKENLAAPVEDRITAGRAIANVHVVNLSHEEGSADWAQLRCAENQSKFRAGSSLVLHKGDPGEGTPCRLLTEGELEFRVGADFRSKIKGVQVGPGWTLDEGWSDYSDNLRRALEELAKSPRRHWIHALLTGARKPTFDRERLERARDLTAGPALDEDQALAFQKAYAVQGYHLVQGPPGSGKTAVLAQLAATLASEGQKVLVTAVTHRAINHALRKTQALRPSADVVKVGGSERAEEGVSTFETFTGWRSNALAGGVVLGATCHTRLDAAFFDTVIFDESSQLPIPLALRGMLAGKRYVFIGDDQQMDPVVVAEHKEAWVAWSAFRLLKQYDAGTLLGTTYRLNAELNAFPSKAFYDGRLRSSEAAAGRKIRYARRPQHWAIMDPDVPSIIVEVPHRGATVRSPEEARLAAALALDAVRSGIHGSEIGIITPYRAQERLIKSELVRQAGATGIPRGLVVETVERVQGQERDLAIISMTVSDLAYAKDSAEFFFRPSRFNVALTRARTKRIVLMDPGLLRSRPTGEQGRWAANLRAFHTMTPKVPAP